VLRVGLALHGLVLYSGLAVTGLVLIARALQSLAVSAAARGIAGMVTQMGLATTAAAKLRIAFSTISPLGWVALAAGVLIGLSIALSRSRSANQQWLDSLNKNITTATGFANQQLITQKNVDLVTQSMVMQKVALQKSEAAITAVFVGRGRLQTGDTAGVIAHSLAIGQDQGAIDAWNKQIILSNQFLSEGASQAHVSVSAFQTIADVLGITAQQVDQNKNSWQAYNQQIEAYLVAIQPIGGTNAQVQQAMAALGLQFNDTYTAINSVNSAMDTYIALAGQIAGASVGAFQALSTLKTDAGVAGASMTGVNDASLALQSQFVNTLVPAIQKTADAMKLAGKPTKDLATYVATLLSPAVNDGALKNDQFRNTIFQLAVEAGYHGLNNIRDLRGWIDKMAGSLQHAADIANTQATPAAQAHGNAAHVATPKITTYANAVSGLNRNLLGIPKTVTTLVKVVASSSGSVQWHLSGKLPGQPGSAGINFGGALGGRVPGHGKGDTVPAMLTPGEAVVPTRLVPLIAPFLHRQGVPGFATGGLIGRAGAPAAFVDNAGASFAQVSEKDIVSAVIALMASAVKTANSIPLGRVGGPTPTSGTVIGWITAAMTASGTPSGWLAGLERLVSIESGGNPNAWNPRPAGTSGEHAEGLWQMIPSTFASWSKGGSIWDPIAEGIAAMGYINANYRGSVYNIPNLYSTAYQGYDSGGWLPPGVSMAVNRTGRHEMVTPAGQLDALIGAVQENTDAICGALDQLTAVTAAAPGATGGSLAATLNGVARAAGYSAIYNTRP
jgi:SLT domain-containing protein